MVQNRLQMPHEVEAEAQAQAQAQAQEAGKAGQVQLQSPKPADDIFAWWHPHEELPKQRYTHEDLLVAIPSTHARLPLVMASR